MLVRMLVSHKSHRKGQTFDLINAVALKWISEGLAESAEALDTVSVDKTHLDGDDARLLFLENRFRELYGIAPEHFDLAMRVLCEGFPDPDIRVRIYLLEKEVNGKTEK
uniref:hypothetical protein n=1 Tax=Leptospirillum ferriphilum TaxID=178606 RepID=UPI0006B1674A|nr:hypothetical protein [Leptospirillum ferriphilum]